MQFYPSVDISHLSPKSTEEQILCAFDYIRESLKQNFRVTVLVKKPADIKEIVDNAMNKKKNKDWQNRQRTKSEIKKELKESIILKLRQSQDKFTQDPRKSISLLNECKELYESAQDFKDDNLILTVYLELIGGLQFVNESEDVIFVIQEKCIQLIQAGSNQLKSEFAEQFQTLQLIKTKYLINQAQKCSDQPEKSLQFFREALQVNDNLPEEKYNAVKIRLSIAQILQHSKDQESVSKIWLETLSLIDKYNTPDFLNDKKYLLYNLGQFYYERKDENEALKYWLLTISIMQEQNQNGQLEQQEKLQYGQLLNYIGTIYFQRKDLKRSIPYLESSITIFQETYGKTHIFVGNKLNNLGEAYRNDKQFDRALDMFIQSKDIKRAEFKTVPNKSLANTINNIGLTLQNMKKFDYAIQNYLEALQQYELPGVFQDNSRGESFISKANTCHSIAECYKALHELDGAEKYFKLAYDMRSQELTINHRNTQSTAIQLATIYFQSSKFQEALEIFKLLLKSQQSNAKDSLAAGQTMNNISSILVQLQQYEEALTYVTQAIRILELNLEQNDPTIAKSKEAKKQILLKLAAN